MKPISGLLILLALSLGGLYLTLVGLLGAYFGEPLGFLFIALGIIALAPLVKAYNEN